MKVEFLVPAGAYLLCDVSEFSTGVVCALTVPAGVYYSVDESSTEVFVGDYDDETAVGRVGLLAGDVALAERFDADDLIVFDRPFIVSVDENGFSFGDLVFEI